MKKVLKFFMKKNVYMTIILIIIGLIVYYILKKLINRYIERHKGELNNKKITYFNLLRGFIKYFIIIVIGSFILETNGINITSVIAGLGIASVIAGLALQDALKDIIMGINIIIDDYFSVGDVIKVNDVEGKVVSLGLKATKIKDINDGRVLVIANRNISSALIMTNAVPINIPLPYELSLKDAEKKIDEIIREIEKIDNIAKVDYLGIDEFADSAIIYKIVLRVEKDAKLTSKRKANCIIKSMLDEANISIPYTQIDVHNK